MKHTKLQYRDLQFYVSLQEEDDVQGIVMKGREECSLIVGHGLRRISAASLRQPALGAVTQRQKVDEMPVMQRHIKAAKEAAKEYKAALSLGKDDAEQLLVKMEFGSRRVGDVRKVLVKKQLDSLAEQAQKQLELDSLFGDGLVAARQQLVANIAPSSVAGNSSDAANVNGEDNKDDNEEELTRQQEAQEAQVQDSEGWQRSSTLTPCCTRSTTPTTLCRRAQLLSFEISRAHDSHFSQTQLAACHENK